MRTLLLTPLFLLSFGGAALATQCVDKRMLDDQLGKQFGESELATGLSKSNAVKIYRNPASQTWSMVVIMPNGVACVVATGESMEISANLPVNHFRSM